MIPWRFGAAVITNRENGVRAAGRIFKIDVSPPRVVLLVQISPCLEIHELIKISSGKEK